MAETATLVHHDELEKDILSAVLASYGFEIGTTNIYRLLEILTPECFYDSRNAEIWRAVRKLTEAGESPDSTNMYVHAQKNPELSAEYVMELAIRDTDLLGHEVERGAMRLRELSQRRRMWLLGTKLLRAGTTEYGDDVDVILTSSRKELEGIENDSNNDEKTMKDGFKEVIRTIGERVRQVEAGQDGTKGTPTGFRFLDSKGGLMPTDLIIIGGATSMGKTSFATSIILSAISSGEHVAMYSLEMSLIQLSARVAAMKTGISSTTILNSGEKLTAQQVVEIDDTADRINAHLLHISDKSTTTLEKILTSIRAMRAKYGIAGAVIDYIKLIGMNGPDYRGMSVAEKLAEASRQFKNIAKELNIWVICLSQLNTLEKADPYPTLDNIYGSREIAAAADYVMLVYRAEYYKKPYPQESGYSTADTHNTAVINVAKGRNTGTGTFLCEFLPEITLFRDIKGMPRHTPPSTWKDTSEENQKCPF